ncbi:YgfZ/GcvT domain-containing protein [Kordiimonas laminariae]|uniref:CAF17-like 4Fe-4S cluster assembly/insertion protein YgfZ n=1 Tax=Kordiimonas laminariae TaxID=2917717 RepID=UPI001FF41C1D|nr:hypothetical protein [Kordiimonas laminariae]MCK0068627.1 hypothetical protein [Kordiimonas laminariae]
MTTEILELKNRAVIRISGPDAKEFLNGLVTNDVAQVSDTQAVYAALLTPQGKFFYDMLITQDSEGLLLDIEAKTKADLLRRLMMYKLRAQVEITETDLKVWALFGGEADKGTSFQDPRHKALHKRVLANTNPAADANDLPYLKYEERRIRHGIPDGSRDILTEKYFWLETNAEALNGVSFSKGCYVGQELTARMKHRTTLKKMIVPVELTSGTFETGDAITTADGSKAGEIRTHSGDYALAYLKLEHREAELKTEGATFKAL